MAPSLEDEMDYKVKIQMILDCTADNKECLLDAIRRNPPYLMCTGCNTHFPSGFFEYETRKRIRILSVREKK